MGKRAEPPEGTSLDLHFWLDDKKLAAKASRAGVKRYIPISELSHELYYLASLGVIRMKWAMELMDELEAEGIVTKKDRYRI